MEFDAIRSGVKNVFTPSRLFIYYNERVMEGTVGKDSGGQIRDGIKSIAKQGDCPEALWPYLEEGVKVKPAGKCYSTARSFKAIQYQRIGHNLDHMRACLASGYPFVFGIKVFSSFEGDAVRKSGKLDMPRKNEKTVGLHAVVACGYDDSIQRFWVRNSWGSGWGKRGYFTIPYEYLLDPKISHDFWTIRVVR
jgi:C1A family cysteine protease